MSASAAQGLTIGELAKVAEVNVETIRYYQKRGLLPEIQPPEVGYKRYPMDMLKRITFIKSAQHLAFSLSEIKILLDLSDLTSDKEKIRTVANERLEQVRQTKKHLTLVEKTLKEWIHTCETSDPKTPCPIINHIKQNDLKSS